MHRTIIFIATFIALAAGSLVAQPEARQVFVHTGGGPGQSMSTSMVSSSMVSSGMVSSGAPVQGSPYSATVVNESVQTLADGNRIVERSTGTTARDSQGRTRNDAALPAIGNMSAAGMPHLAFIVDPVAEVSYTLNLDEKTAHSMSGKVVTSGSGKVMAAAPLPPLPQLSATIATAGGGLAGLPPLPPPAAGAMVMAFKGHKEDLAKEQAETKTEDLGSQVIEGVNAHGVRSTRTIPAGEIGNEKPIDIVTEVWTSPDLKTIVLSKRSDPRTGEQTFQLTNVVRSEPDPSLFTVPSDFKTVDAAGPGNMIFYHSKE